MSQRFSRIICLGWVLVAASQGLAQAPPNQAEHATARAPVLLPGQKADGSVLLPNQWSLRPVGQQVPLAGFPGSIAVHPTSRWAAILNCGYERHGITVVELPSGRLLKHYPINEAFYGLRFSPDGRQLFCSGAGDEVVHRFDFQQGLLGPDQPLSLRPAKERGIPAGLAVNRVGRTLYVANLWGHRVTEIDLTASQVRREIRLSASVLATVTNQGPVDFDIAASTKRTIALTDPTTAKDAFPYACCLDEKRGRLYVSLWAQAALAVIDLKNGKVIGQWPTGEHPNEMLLDRSGRRLFVANASHNSVSVLDPGAGRAVETLSTSLYPLDLAGATPNSLALSRDEKTLFVANADNNNVAVFDVSRPGHSRSLGFIPVGWYPTSVRVTPNGKFLLVANGKGLISKANPKRQYIGGLFTGSLSLIPLPRRAKLEQQVAADTQTAFQCNRLRADAAVTAARPADSPIPGRVGEASPIKYCFYIIKENRTYDQVLGDLPQGNGDPKLCLFGDQITPNHHQLAREFVLLDNFYVDGEVSADGHEWTMAAYATDFVEKTWPLSYGHNGKHGKYPYPSEGNFKVALPPAGYLWDRAREAGVSYRSYGEFVANGKTLRDPAKSRVVTLQGHFDEWFHGWDLDYPDVKRTEHLVQELKRFEQAGDMPRLQVIRLPNDHTSGTTAGKHTPRAMVADNDLALGQFLEALSHSTFWAQTAVFILEDDAQNGPDHVDAHRSIAFVMSPYAKRQTVDSTMYSTSSMLRTIELILGLQPMSQYDAAATPMYNAFQAQPDLRPFQHLPARIDLNEKNRKLAWGSERSAKMDFSKEDAADENLLNEIIWRSVRGADHPMPAPTRAAFVFTREADRDDD